MRISPLTTTIEAAMAMVFVYFVLGADDWNLKIWPFIVIFAVWITANLYSKLGDK